MDQVTGTGLRPHRGRALAVSLPNILTYGRILAVPALVAVLYFIPGDTGRTIAFALFAAASVTDWLDGYLARIWAQQSELGRMLDPIADKLLVGAVLMMMVYDRTIAGAGIFAAIIILTREILVSGLREFLAELNVKVHVSWLSKWKTAFQMIALAALILGPAIEKQLPHVVILGTALLWASALLTIWTGYDYLKAAVVRAIEDKAP